ncbi:hypothetical protein [Thermofilum pendens]|uniref:hypothetical protein n=1 Tax=Thermofilum pendens TaxID=2269 RepID=UPI000AE55500|nr:hypothetical protein [Thermofilum pendens]
MARWKSTGAWVLVYGRRKVGKSYFIRNFTKWDSYYFVGRERLSGFLTCFRYALR